MRDKVIHGYFTIRLELVWDTVQRDLPQLQEEIGRMLRELEAKEGRRP